MLVGVIEGTTDGNRLGLLVNIEVGIVEGFADCWRGGEVGTRKGFPDGLKVGTIVAITVGSEEGTIVGEVVGGVAQMRSSFSNTSTASALTLMNGYSPKPGKSTYISFALDPFVYSRLPKS